MKRVGFLSFGHWQPVAGSQTQNAREALVQTVELAVAGEAIGIDGAFVRVHHFARQLASPFPLLAAIAARTSRIEIGTAVIDMRYENPLYMAEEAAAADLISDGRLQLGISRGSPEPALRGSESFGYVPGTDETDGDLARAHTALFRAAISGAGVAHADTAMTGSSAMLAIQPRSPGLADRIWWGAGTRKTAEWTAQQGMNLMSSTLLSEDTGVPFDELQAEQIALYRAAWAAAGWERTPRISVSRSVLPIVSDIDRMYFGARSGQDSADQVGYLEGVRARFGKSYIGEPDVIAEELSRDAAVLAADTLMLTVPNQLGVDYNANLLDTFARHIGPAIGWHRKSEPTRPPDEVGADIGAGRARSPTDGRELLDDLPADTPGS
jgi:alkanesulfonate monooxygenase SsuD/methylene tetrahydromethanopterin reductase-like flavin-dependent oxidoreductase (luciferase family)